MSNHLTRPIKMEADMEMNCDSADEDSMLQTDIIGQLESGSGLGMMNSLDSGTEMLSQNMGFMMENGEDPENDENILMQHMDIRDPLSTLKELLEQRIGIELEGYEFWLQDAQMLEAHKNLVDQCVQGKGLVQINVQIRTLSKRINIVDVLKPHDEYADVSENGDGSEEQDGEQMVPEQADDDPDIDSDPDKQAPNTVIKWLVDEQFKKDQQRLSIPEDPMMWSIAHVRHWLQWAVRQFHLANIKTRDWNISGHTLCNLTLREFQRKVPSDPGNVFWTHLELLRKCKFVAILQKDTVEDQMPAIIRKSPKGALRKPVKPASGLDFTALPEFPPIAGNKSGNNGQVQLWQFLLEILTEKEYRSAIQWVGADGEFKLNNPEYVAQLWGHRKNKPMMNYEKLSRALRYYYDGDMISKVHGKRFVYKFVCDLKQLLGYDAAELANLVNQTTNTNSVHYLW